MSGVKQATLSLDEQLQQELDSHLRILQEAQATGRIARIAVAEVRPLLDEQEQSLARWAEVELRQLSASHSSLSSRSILLDEALKSSDRLRLREQGPLEALRATRLDSDALSRLVSGLRDEALALQAGAESIGELAALRVNQEHGTAMRRQALVVGLGGIADELKRELGRGPSSTFQWYRAEAEELAARIRKILLKPRELQTEDLASARAALERLAHQSAEAERNDLQRREIGQRLDSALSDVGIRCVLREDDGSLGREPLSYRHASSGNDRVRVDSSIDWHRHLQIHMFSDRDEDTMNIEDASCSLALREVIDRAKELGLFIEEVRWEGPDGLMRSVDIGAQSTRTHRGGVKWREHE